MTLTSRSIDPTGSPLPFYIVTYDKTSWILEATCYLYNKYWVLHGGQRQEFKVLGGNPPKTRMPDNFEFIGLRNWDNVQMWTRGIYEFISTNERNDYFVLTTDDSLPNSHLNSSILEELIAYARRRTSVGRIGLGRIKPERCPPPVAREGFSLMTLRQDAAYRLSLQTSIWRKDYFEKYFDHDWTLWQLEVEGSRLAENDGAEIIGANDASPFDWIAEGALSRKWPGMVNILGLPKEDLRYLIEERILDPMTLQYGMWAECTLPFLSRFPSLWKRVWRPPRFSKIGYDFDWEVIRNRVKPLTFAGFREHYGRLY